MAARAPERGLAVLALLSSFGCQPLDDFRVAPCPTGDCGPEVAADGADATDAGPDDAGDANVADEGPPTAEGCSDSTREGYQSISIFPAIAACAGGWSVPGVVRAGLVPTCNREAGNDSSNADGGGCAAADLCGRGWHVCAGRAEVAANAADGCTMAVPPGAPDKSLLFVVAQPSAGALSCAGSTGDDDLFGCGNLGVELNAAGDCYPLNRALASQVDGACAFNEAEPPLGPWQCPGGAGSHAHEGANVIKYGCPGLSCSWNSAAIGNSAKGGVICCRN